MKALFVFGGIVTVACLAYIFVQTRGGEAQVPPEPRREAPAGGYGDINGDGWVSQADLDMIRQMILAQGSFTADQIRRADVNGDGSVSAYDYSLVQLYMNGHLDIFPVMG